MIVSDADSELVAERRRHIDALAGSEVGYILNRVLCELGELAGLFLRPRATARGERRAVGAENCHFNPPHGIPFQLCRSVPGSPQGALTTIIPPTGRWIA